MKLLLITLVVCTLTAPSLGGLFSSVGDGIRSLADRGRSSDRGVNRNRTPSSNNLGGLASLAANTITAPARAAVSVAREEIVTPESVIATLAPAPNFKAAAAIATTAPKLIVSRPTTAVNPPATQAPAPRPVVVATAEARAYGDSKATATAVSSDSHFGPSGTADVVSADHSSHSTDSQSEILHYEAQFGEDGYYYSYKTSNGISAESTGELRNVNGSDVIVMRGYYEYIDRDGNPVEVHYTADEEGFHPESDILPVAPPVPDEIAASIEYILRLNREKEQTEAASQ